MNNKEGNTTRDSKPLLNYPTSYLLNNLKSSIHLSTRDHIHTS